MSKLNLLCSLGLVVALGLSGCGTPESSGPATKDQSAGDGRLSFRIVDAPGDAEHLWVSVQQISLRPCEGGGWIDAPTVTTEFDLMALAEGDAFKTLTQAAFIPLGTYCETRLVLGEEALIELEGGETYPLKVPSGDSSGYKIKGEYQVKDDALTIVTLDFDAQKSLHKAENSGKYILKPVVFIASVSYEELDTELIYTDHLKQRLVEEGNNVLEVQVSFSSWMPLSEVRALLQDSGPEVYRLHALSNLMGKTLHATVPLSSPDLPSGEIEVYLENTIQTTKSESRSKQATEILNVGVDLGLVSSSLRAKGPASVILSWWILHPDQIRVVQILNDSFGNAQRPILPEDKL